jgi:hypothetical protein
MRALSCAAFENTMTSPSMHKTSMNNPAANGNGRKLFTFDQVFPPNTGQEEIYNWVDEYVQAAVNGYNATVFTYG